MNADQQTLLMFKGLIASLPEESQQKVKDAEARIHSILEAYPEGEAMVAFGKIGAELQMRAPEMVTK